MVESTPIKPIKPAVDYKSLTLFRMGPPPRDSASTQLGSIVARFNLKQDISPLFPYINAALDNAQLYQRPVYIRFFFQEHLCAFYPCQGLVSPIRDYTEAFQFIPELIAFLGNISERQADFAPDHRRYHPSSAIDIYRLLPGDNCEKCGYKTCIAFAAALSRLQTTFVKCPHLSSPEEEKALFNVYDQKGRLLKKIALRFDTASFQKHLDQKQARIEKLQSQIAHFKSSSRKALDDANTRLPTPLTNREIQVLRLLAQGATNKIIACELHISEHTVKSHIIHIFNKLGVNDRTQAAVWAALNGVLLT